MKRRVPVGHYDRVRVEVKKRVPLNHRDNNAPVLPEPRNHGQSYATVKKELGIGAALEIGFRLLRLSKMAGRGYSYWAGDFNCGSGFNDRIGVPGTPISLYEAWERCGMQNAGFVLQSFFCDKDDKAINILEDKLADMGKVAVFLRGDNEDELKHFASKIAEKVEPDLALGHLVIDPNGYFYRNARSDGPPIESLRWFLPKFPNFDVILNLNIRTYRLMMGHAFRGTKAGLQWQNLPTPREVLASLPRKYWLVTHTSVQRGTFFLAVGRNRKSGKSSGFAWLDSPEGQRIMDDVTEIKGITK